MPFDAVAIVVVVFVRSCVRTVLYLQPDETTSVYITKHGLNQRSTNPHIIQSCTTNHHFVIYRTSTHTSHTSERIISILYSPPQHRKHSGMKHGKLTRNSLDHANAIRT
ncbi:hypothetical protein BO99DRAFT_84084 [Aspergillus violaceofuscus CBS 115571]|uniref:Secreted protein n=1 Tax=Aspergillus violaceofuscus (strain CBS 115571) TaxID=1450538 RepID=A0A2V5GUT8_ASPV1|nr:hypothetical protein BO99DRAFT_84084 [Aspergillus violaceofuscus CBS 115571]